MRHPDTGRVDRYARHSLEVQGSVADAVAEALGIDTVVAEVLPEHRRGRCESSRVAVAAP